MGTNYALYLRAKAGWRFSSHIWGWSWTTTWSGFAENQRESIPVVYCHRSVNFRFCTCMYKLVLQCSLCWRPSYFIFDNACPRLKSVTPECRICWMVVALVCWRCHLKMWRRREIQMISLGEGWKRRSTIQDYPGNTISSHRAKDFFLKWHIWSYVANNQLAFVIDHGVHKQAVVRRGSRALAFFQGIQGVRNNHSQEQGLVRCVWCSAHSPTCQFMGWGRHTWVLSGIDNVWDTDSSSPTHSRICPYEPIYMAHLWVSYQAHV